MKLILFTVTAFSISFLSCNSDSTRQRNHQPSDSTGFNKQWASSFIDSVNMVFSKQVTSGDSVGLANTYWPDAELIFDYSEPIKGDAILNTWGEIIRGGLKEMRFVTKDITGCSDLVVETGTYEMNSSSNKLMDKGNYVVAWQKRGDQWKLYRDIGATSMPYPKP